MKIVDHRANAMILDYLRGKSSPTILANIAPESELAYTDHTHPELANLLRAISRDLPSHQTTYVYGFLVVANQQGVICAAAISMITLAFRLPEQAQIEASQQGARAMSSIGEGWLEFNPWKPRVSDQDRIEIFRAWCEKAYVYISEMIS